ncbi:FAD-dependent oxidoreductase [Herbiconiux sp. 11R-BC]|uniref:NAD(P)/FAD-dependent oxidoreductase n=1 Tax=Herbiconiux sp. 11R-BC TaxID=3111637 RepID=UPI003C01EE8D
MTSSDISPSTPAEVLVVGAGISGLACARALRQEGVAVRVIDRGRRPGGRMSGRTLHDRVVDLGASYFTVPDGSGFAAVVADWEHRGLVHPWTDTFAVLGTAATGETAEGGTSTETGDTPTSTAGTARRTTGPLRYAAARGLRSLAVDLAAELHVERETEFGGIAADGTADGIRYGTVVLAMPEPQAARLLPPSSALAAQLDTHSWGPVIAVALGFAECGWPAELHGAFVHGSPILTFLADDGDRRGDGAPVIVAHSTAGFARAHLEQPDGAVRAVEAEVRALLGIDPGIRTDWSHAHRWTFARATTTHPEPFALQDGVGICGDAWGGRSSVATAWASGDALGRAIARRR